MSWASIANNQCISFNNLQDAVTTNVFVLKAAIPVSLEQITKTDADTYVYIDITYGPYAAKASNQLVVKSDLQPPPTTTTTTTTILYDVYTAEKYDCASCTLDSSPVLVALPSGSTPNFGNYYVPSIGSGEQGLYSYVLLASSVGAGLILENQSYVLCADACNV
jgi:hypothetical protein